MELSKNWLMVRREGLADFDQKMVGRRITALYKAKGWSQATFATQIHVSPQRLTNWEAGRNMIPVDIAIRVSLISETHIMFIYQGIIDKKIDPEYAVRIMEELRKLDQDDNPGPQKRGRRLRRPAIAQE